MAEDFDAPAALAQIKTRRALMRRRRYWPRSKLYPYHAEIMALVRAGASQRDIVVWLRMQHALSVTQPTLQNYLKRRRELAVLLPDA